MGLIFLYGMPGSGKTTLGKRLAQKLKLPFYDLDIEIEKREGRSISEIFASDGEAYFRKVEESVVKWSCKLPEGVVSTGGGAPCFFDNAIIMNIAGMSVFIDVSPGELVQRVYVKEEDDSRPMNATKACCRPP